MYSHLQKNKHNVDETRTVITLRYDEIDDFFANYKKVFGENAFTEIITFLYDNVIVSSFRGLNDNKLKSYRITIKE